MLTSCHPALVTPRIYYATSLHPTLCPAKNKHSSLYPTLCHLKYGRPRRAFCATSYSSRRAFDFKVASLPAMLVPSNETLRFWFCTYRLGFQAGQKSFWDTRHSRNWSNWLPLQRIAIILHIKFPKILYSLGQIFRDVFGALTL